MDDDGEDGDGDSGDEQKRKEMVMAARETRKTGKRSKTYHPGLCDAVVPGGGACGRDPEPFGAEPYASCEGEADAPPPGCGAVGDPTAGASESGPRRHQRRHAHPGYDDVAHTCSAPHPMRHVVRLPESMPGTLLTS